MSHDTAHTPNPDTTYIEPDTVRAMAKSGTPLAIVDVRSPEEFAAGHVDGAVNIPIDQLAARAAAELPQGETVVTVCNQGGARSCGAAEQLRQLGFEKALPLRGGTRGWTGQQG